MGHTAVLMEDVKGDVRHYTDRRPSCEFWLFAFSSVIAACRLEVAGAGGGLGSTANSWRRMADWWMALVCAKSGAGRKSREGAAVHRGRNVDSNLRDVVESLFLAAKM